MHCVLLSSPLGEGYWQLHRSVEVLGYHGDEVRILLALYLENLAPGGMENHLGMMHRGNVECRMVPAWPLPQHPDEANAGMRAEKCVLRQIYEPAFAWTGEGLVQRKGLSKWDTWRSVVERRVIAKAPMNDDCKLIRTTDTLDQGCNSWMPFTSWKIGPFKEPGYYLIACVLRFSGETYHEMVDREPDFTVDGPLRLLTRIKCEDLLRLPPRQRSRWAKELSQFDQPFSLIGEEYDVIILASPLACEVHASGQIGIASAPLQPSRGGHFADRFITSDQRFSMVLKYAFPVPSQLAYARSA